MQTTLAVFRRYVCDFVNRHDFSVLPQIMPEDYTLHTAGHTIVGRDGDYRRAVAHQLEQFPGLLYTLHEIHVGEDAVAVHFSEHGASLRHGGRCAGWRSIAIYRATQGLLVSCSIEQDFFSRRRQLASNEARSVLPPAIAPWDTPTLPANTAAEQSVQKWLSHPDWPSTPGIQLSDSSSDDEPVPRLQQTAINVLDIFSSGDTVAFRAVQSGPATYGVVLDPAAQMHIAGIVRVAGSAVQSGHVIQDRWGLARRMKPSP